MVRILVDLGFSSKEASMAQVCAGNWFLSIIDLADRTWNLNSPLVGTILEIPAALDSQREIKAVDLS